jgi:hypothetical protein
MRYKYRYKGEPFTAFLKPEILQHDFKCSNANVTTSILKPYENVKTVMNCWICEGWQEHRIKWEIGKSGSYVLEPVYLHFEIDNFHPRLMKKQGKYFYLDLMLPPGQHQYFYSFNYHPTTNSMYPRIQRDSTLKIFDMYFSDEN